MKNAIKNSSLILSLFVLSMGAAFASSSQPNTTFGHTVSKWQQSLFTITVFTEYLCVILGIIVIVSGIYQMRLGHSPATQQQQQGPRIGMAYLVIGSIMISLGVTITFIGNSITVAPGGMEESISNYMSYTSAAPENYYDRTIAYVLVPFMQLMGYVCPVIGIITVAIGVNRLRYHSNPMMMSAYRRAPMATAFYFIIGAFLIYPYAGLEALSESMFGTVSVYQDYCNSTEKGDSFIAYAKTLKTDYMFSYSDGEFQCTPKDSDKVSDNLIELSYAILFILGFVSVIRGLFLLTRMGEHMGGQPMSASRVVSHVVAGIIAMNANMFITILQTTYDSIFGSTT